MTLFFCGRKLSFLESDPCWNEDAIVELLEEIDDSFLSGNLFVELLFDFSLLKQSVNLEMPAILEDPSHLFKQLTVSQLLMKMVSTISAKSLFHNAFQVCNFLKIMLEQSDNESHLLCLLILDNLIGGKMKLKKEEENLVLDFLPNLKLMQDDPNNELAQMARNLVKKISEKKNGWIVEEEKKEENCESEVENLQNCLNDLGDPLLPVRAHGLITLRKLILEKDKETLENTGRILDIFTEQLRDEDTYIYLNAVQGFSALADVLPSDVLPLLCNHYTDKSLPETHRAKLGETILIIAQRLDQLLHKYSSLFVNTLLSGVKDDSPLVRASSLSNLGTMCKHLRWAVHPFIVDILNCARSALLMEKKGEVMVRRAAVVITVLLLDGMAEDVIQLIGSESFLSLQNLLKRISEDYEEDSVVRAQSLVSLSLIDDILKILFTNYLN